MVRPEAKIDWEKADEMLVAGSPGTEVAAFFGIHADTFYKRVEEKYNMGFSAYLQEKKSKGEALIRLHQFDKALGKTKKGDTQLLMLLGRERLGQKDTKNALDQEYLESVKKILDRVQQNNNLIVHE